MAATPPGALPEAKAEDGHSSVVRALCSTGNSHVARERHDASYPLFEIAVAA